MGDLIRVGIAGLGSYVPKRVLANRELETLVDTSDEWIVQRTGIHERRIAAEDEDSGTMGSIATDRALADAGVAPEDVDLIVCATTSADQVFPSTACHIQERIGAWNCGGFDLNSACSGFVFAFNTAAQFVRSGAYERVLVVGTEKLSGMTDYTDRTTCVIFGDGAGAMLLTPLDDAGRGELVSMSIKTEGGHDDVLEVPAGGSRLRPSFETIEKRLHFMKMGGNKVYKFAVKTFAQLVRDAVEPYDADELGLVIPHQVNKRIIEAAIDRLEIDPALVYTNIERYGNTAAASIPVAFDEASKEGRLVDGKLVCACAFGAGLSWGHFMVRW